MKNLLIMERDPELRELFKYLLADSHHLELVPHYDQLLHAITVGSPDLILVDCIDFGPQTRIKIEHLIGLNLSCPTGMLSTRSDAVDNYAELGFDFFIPKPFDIYYLRDEIKHQLSLSQNNGPDNNLYP